MTALDELVADALMVSGVEPGPAERMAEAAVSAMRGTLYGLHAEPHQVARVMSALVDAATAMPWEQYPGERDEYDDDDVAQHRAGE